MLGEKIKELRQIRGYSCSELARKSNHPVSSIHAIENGGNKNPRFEIICDIADVLNISLDELKKSVKEVATNEN